VTIESIELTPLSVSFIQERHSEKSLEVLNTRFKGAENAMDVDEDEDG
jgi:hypothetical protein